MNLIKLTRICYNCRDRYFPSHLRQKYCSKCQGIAFAYKKKKFSIRRHYENKKYNKKNKEEISKKKKAYFQKHREEILAKRREYRATHKELISQINKKYHERKKHAL